jgi:hypothetical protein
MACTKRRSPGAVAERRVRTAAEAGSLACVCTVRTESPTRTLPDRPSLSSWRRYRTLLVAAALCARAARGDARPCMPRPAPHERVGATSADAGRVRASRARRRPRGAVTSHARRSMRRRAAAGSRAASDVGTAQTVSPVRTAPGSSPRTLRAARGCVASEHAPGAPRTTRVGGGAHAGRRQRRSAYSTTGCPIAHAIGALGDAALDCGMSPIDGATLVMASQRRQRNVR